MSLDTPLAPTYRARRSYHWRPVATVACALVAGLGAGMVGGVIVAHHPVPAVPTQKAEMPPPAPVAPSVETVRTQTISLCTEWGSLYAGIPVPQDHVADVVPTMTGIADALTNNPAADPGVRSAITAHLQTMRTHVAYLAGIDARGAVQPPRTWDVDAAHAAGNAAWHACDTWHD